MRVLFAGGGTGGHIVPGRNLAEWLRSDDPNHHAVRFLTAGRKVEDSFFEKCPWTRTALFQGQASRPSLLFPIPWLKAWFLARREMARFKPHALILLGGYASLPAALASMGRVKALYVLEQNAHPGKASRLTARIGRRIFCHFQAAADRLGVKAIVTGSPLPPDFGRFGSMARGELKKHFGLDPDCRTLMVAGGSQGARAVNDLVMAACKQIAGRHGDRIQVLHVTGSQDYERIRDGYRDSSLRAALYPFIDPMERAYRAADLIICRGGGMTLAEISAVGLPAVIVPYPHHKDRHQYHNSMELEAAGGALVLDEHRAGPDEICRLLDETLFDDQRRTTMAEMAGRVGRRDGAKRILDLIRGDVGEGLALCH